MSSEFCGKIVKVKGKADVLRLRSFEKTDRIALEGKKRLKLLCSDVVVTRAKSRLKLKLASGSLALGPNARLEILNYLENLANTDSVVSLLYGKVRAVIKKKKKQQFRIKTPSSVMGVRGTDFYVSFDPIRFNTKQATIEGAVEVEIRKTGQVEIVTAGHEVEIKKSEPVLKVEHITKKVIGEIQAISNIVNADQEFKSPQAIEILGPAEAWEPTEYVLPEDLKDMSKEF